MNSENNSSIIDEQKKEELKQRVENFNKELIPLLSKYKVGLNAIPFFFENGRVGAKPIIFDNSEKEKKEEPEQLKRG